MFIAPEEIPITVTGRPQKFKLAELVRQRLRASGETPRNQ
jgi:hypothetical protein